MCGIGMSSMLRLSRCRSKECHCSKFPCRTRLCTKPSRHALGAATRGTPKPPSCDHEQPALCRCPATAPGRAAPMATTPPEGTSCSSRRCPQWHLACTCLHTRTRRSSPVSVVSYRHSAFPSLASNGVTVALVLLSVGTATVSKLTTRPSPPNRTSSVRRCGSPARSRRSTPQSCASGVRRRLRGDPSPASSRH